jgi:hypothetical protein
MILDEDASNAFVEAMKQIEDEEEEFWSKLTEEEQLKAFCCVVRRIHKGELVDDRSYRGVLYDVFEFGPESYVRAQMAGYLDIHNAIVKETK